MKIEKQKQKQLVQFVKERANDMGFQVKENSMYKKLEENFFHTDYLIVNSEKIVYRVYVKKYSYDDIFWNIMNMQENIKKKDSLRAIGAYKSPSILIEKGEISLNNEIGKLAQDFVTHICDISNEFIKKYRLSDYIVTKTDLLWGEMLKCIAYIDMGILTEAEKIAKKEVDKGEKGAFINEGKGFYEWVLEYLRNLSD